ncbi:MAG: NUDIX hydrolase [Nitriliruptoraceae bacterium]
MSAARQLAPSEQAPDVDVEGAGGVVLRPGPDGPQVLVVHRVRYDDWSLPKGKLDPGEDHVTAALREVLEETGVRAEVAGPELSQFVYPVNAGLKRVRWYPMRPRDGDPAERPPDREVDRARWLAATTAQAVLSYPADVALLEEALAGHDVGGTP